MRSHTSLRTFAVVAMLCATTAATAVETKDEYEKKIKAAQDVAPLGNDLAGDRVNYLDGMVTFHATEASLPGNNALPVAIGRSYKVDFDNPGYSPFGDWTLDLPYIGTTMSSDGGWVVDSTTPNNRCSVVGAQRPNNGGPATGEPPLIVVPEAFQSGGHTPQYHGFYGWEYWHGYTLSTPAGEQSVLLAPTTNTQRPTPTPSETFHWNTNQDWWLSCLPASATTGGGEGFKAWAPDGTKYTFDQMGYGGSEMLEYVDDWQGDLDNPTPLTFHFELPRTEYRLYASRVEDRFGNWVNYNWANGRLNSITSSDGRAITLTYSANGLISSITDGTRTWNYIYNYDSNSGKFTLTQVVLPDGTKWFYDLSRITNLQRPVGGECASGGLSIQAGWDCYGGSGGTSAIITGTVWHPSGARIDFNFSSHFQPSTNAENLGSWPLALVQKTISGAGLQAATWKYGFAPSKDVFRAGCMQSTGITRDHCPQYVVTDELGPDNSLTRRIFDMRTLLQGEFRGNADAAAPSGGSPRIVISARWGSTYIGDTSPVTGTVPAFYQESDYRYVGDTETVPYTVKVGSNPLVYGDMYSTERRVPQKTIIQTQQGATFTRTTDAWDLWAHPATVTRSSAGLAGPTAGYSRTENTVYSHNTNKWVIGQVATVTDQASGRVISQTDYLTTNAMPSKNYSYGVLKETITYNTDGTVATVKDGGNNTTTMGNWSRGVPQTITYPKVPNASGVLTAYTESAVVANIGTLSSTTDELGSVQNYGYDAMGRLSSIAYPTGDSTVWNSLARGFSWIVTAEYGIAAGHWKQTVQTGNGKTTTIYDALFEPALTIIEDTGTGWKSFVVKRFDSSGREIFSSYPGPALNAVTDPVVGTTTSYDTLGRPITVSQYSEQGALNTTTEYLSGFQTRVTNPRGIKQTTSYQVFDEPKTDAPVKIINGLGLPEGQTTTIARDVFGKPLTITRSAGG